MKIIVRKYHTIRHYSAFCKYISKIFSSKKRIELSSEVFQGSKQFMLHMGGGKESEEGRFDNVQKGF
jgi:hypothetical protein